jgi:hypothetical protein
LSGIVWVGGLCYWWNATSKLRQWFDVRLAMNFLEEESLEPIFGVLVGGGDERSFETARSDLMKYFASAGGSMWCCCAVCAACGLLPPGKSLLVTSRWSRT